METAPTTPPEIKILAIVLGKILAGERQEQVSESLSPTWSAR